MYIYIIGVHSCIYLYRGHAHLDNIYVHITHLRGLASLLGPQSFTSALPSFPSMARTTDTSPRAHASSKGVWRGEGKRGGGKVTSKMTQNDHPVLSAYMCAKGGRAHFPTDPQRSGGLNA